MPRTFHNGIFLHRIWNHYPHNVNVWCTMVGEVQYIARIHGFDCDVSQHLLLRRRSKSFRQARADWNLVHSQHDVRCRYNIYYGQSQNPYGLSNENELILLIHSMDSSSQLTVDGLTRWAFASWSPCSLILMTKSHSPDRTCNTPLWAYSSGPAVL